MYECNPTNTRIIRKYCEWLREAERKSEATINMARKAIKQYEKITNYLDFKYFKIDFAINFKHILLSSKSKVKKERLSASTIHHRTKNIKKFFIWLSGLSGYKSRINLNDLEYFNLSNKETKIAQSSKLTKYPTSQEIKKVVSNMPFSNEIEKRNRALIAFTFLTGIRDGALASLKIKHIDLERSLVEQDPKDVNTKFSKMIYTYFFPVDESIKKIVVEWFNFLVNEKLYGNNNPLFPRTKLSQDKNNCFQSDGLEPQHWKTANPIRNIFKDAFQSYGLDYYKPHSFRTTLAMLGESICKTPEDFKAWSQNLGHESPMTTFYSYGHINPYRQGEIVKNIGKKESISYSSETSKKIDLILKKLDL